MKKSAFSRTGRTCYRKELTLFNIKVYIVKSMDFHTIQIYLGEPSCPYNIRSIIIQIKTSGNFI
jgi:hypothetical protein